MKTAFNTSHHYRRCKWFNKKWSCWNCWQWK